MKTNKTNLLFAFALSSIFLCKQSFSQEVLLLPDAIKLALDNNLQIKIAHNKRKMAEEKSSWGYAGYYPQLSLNGGYTGNVDDTELKFLNGETLIRDNARSSGLNASLDFRYPLFDGFARLNTYNSFRESEAIENLHLKASKEDVVKQVIALYYKCSADEALQYVLSEVLKVSVERLSIADNKYKLGVFSKMDFLQARLDYYNDSIALLEQEQHLYESRVMLNRWIGQKTDVIFKTSELPKEEEKMSLESLNQEAMQANTSLLLLNKNRSMGVLQLKNQQASLYPQIDLLGNLNLRRAQTEAGFVQSTRNSGLLYGLSVSYPLFNGFQRQTDRNIAKIHIENTELAISDAQVQLEAELAVLHAQYSRKLQQLKLIKLSYAIASESMEVAKESYRLGSISSLQFRDAQLKYNMAGFALIRAMYEITLAKNNMLYLSGNLAN
jgi:outer membrane protein